MDKEGDAEPSSWENEGFAGFLPTLITCRRCDDAVGEGRWFKGLTVDLGWRGRRWGRGLLERRLLLDQEGKGRQMLTLPRWLLEGLQLTAAVKPLLVHHVDGDDVQELDWLLEKLML